MEESLRADVEVRRTAATYGKSVTCCLDAAGDEGDFALATGGEVKRVANCEVQ